MALIWTGPSRDRSPVSPVDLGSGLDLRGILAVLVGAALLTLAGWVLLKAIDIAVLVAAGLK